MVTFGKKKSYTDWLYTRPVLVFLAGLILFMGAAVFERLGVERDMYARQVTAEAELLKAKERQNELRAEVEYLEGERGIEEEIRKHFDVAREGETVIILTGEIEKPEVEPIEQVEPETAWYQFWR